MHNNRVCKQANSGIKKCCLIEICGHNSQMQIKKKMTEVLFILLISLKSPKVQINTTYYVVINLQVSNNLKVAASGVTEIQCLTETVLLTFEMTGTSLSTVSEGLTQGSARSLSFRLIINEETSARHRREFRTSAATVDQTAAVCRRISKRAHQQKVLG